MHGYLFDISFWLHKPEIRLGSLVYVTKTHITLEASHLLALLSSTVPVVLTIIVTETLLSIDNALIVVALTKELPFKEQKRAHFLGIIVFGMGLRIITLLAASLLVKHDFLLCIGSCYLIWVAFSNIKKSFDEENNPGTTHATFWLVVRQIMLTDLAFSIDNVIIAVGLSPNIYIVMIGVAAGIVTMFFASSLVSVIMDRYPSLKTAAFVIVGIIGAFMLIEHLTPIHIHGLAKLGLIALIILITIFVAEYRKRRSTDCY